MKKNIGKIVLGFIYLFLPVMQAQERLPDYISYEYDANGGRISRKVIYLPVLKSGSVRLQAEDTGVMEDNWQNKKVRVYPNPTQGILKINVDFGQPIESESEIVYRLYDSFGVLLLEYRSDESVTILNLMSYPKGWYILRLQSGDSIKEYKIIRN